MFIQVKQKTTRNDDIKESLKARLISWYRWFVYMYIPLCFEYILFQAKFLRKKYDNPNNTISQMWPV